MKIVHILFSSFALAHMVGCQTLPISQQNINVPQRLRTMNRLPSIEAIIESKFSYSPDKSTLTAQFKDSDGQITLYRTTKTGDSVQAETITLQNGQEVNKRLTTPNEARLVIKVAASNGLADIYRDLNLRYQQAGLTQ